MEVLIVEVVFLLTYYYLVGSAEFEVQNGNYRYSLPEWSSIDGFDRDGWSQCSMHEMQGKVSLCDADEKALD